MTRIILSGANGFMGRVITRCAAERDDCTIVAGIDRNAQANADFPVFASPAEVTVEADVIIDFSHPSALEPLLKMAKEKNLAAVISTTGLSEEQVALVSETAKKIPILRSANMSLGVNLIRELARTAARVLGKEYDIEIVEKHHNRKLDAPSGTALMLADGISEVLDDEPQYIYDRHSRRSKREKNEIGLHAVRGGTIVGEHDIIFAGHDEVITISHSAASREVFATGSINAALFLADKPAGLYSMQDMM